MARPPRPGDVGPALGQRPLRPGRIDVDFSLAIHNRTGKYFIGRDVLAVLGDRVRRVYYGGVAFSSPPTGLLGRGLGRLQLWHVKSRAGRAPLRLPRRRGGPPLLHLDPFTVQTAPLRRQDAVLCHDVGPLTDPELFDPGVGAIYTAIYAEVAAVGPHLVFVSEATREAFARLFPAARPASARIVYPMLRAEVTPKDEPDPRQAKGGPFLLTVGSIGSRKNQLRCIEAFEQSGLAREGMRYVICGGPEPGFEDVERAAAETAGVELLPYVRDEELAWLYRHATGFVLASLLEGFGIPVAEAVAAGLVPIVSAGGVLEEVAGPGALSVDPRDTGQIAALMRTLCAMGSGERAARLDRLRASIARFGPDQLADGWNALFADMIETDANEKAARTGQPAPAISRSADRG